MGRAMPPRTGKEGSNVARAERGVCSRPRYRADKHRRRRLAPAAISAEQDALPLRRKSTRKRDNRREGIALPNAVRRASAGTGLAAMHQPPSAKRLAYRHFAIRIHEAPLLLAVLIEIETARRGPVLDALAIRYILLQNLSELGTRLGCGAWRDGIAYSRGAYPAMSPQRAAFAVHGLRAEVGETSTVKYQSRSGYREANEGSLSSSLPFAARGFMAYSPGTTLGDIRRTC